MPTLGVSLIQLGKTIDGILSKQSERCFSWAMLTIIIDENKVSTAFVDILKVKQPLIVGCINIRKQFSTSNRRDTKLSLVEV